MRITKTLCVAAVPLSACLVAGTAQARDCSGYDVLVNQISDTMELAKGHSLTVTKDASIITTADPKDIYNLTTGACAGTFLTTPDGKTRGAGHCLRKDKDGDTESIEWALAPGSEKGTWRSTGGTGKFAGVVDSGWWQGAVADGKMVVTSWGGTCK